MSDEHMTDQELDVVLRTWLQDEPVGRPDRSRVAGAVVGQLHSTRRRRHGWLPFGRSATQPGPIPASDGHSPTVIGRTHSMISPAKAVAAGAIVFALGSVLFIAQPFDRQGGVPGAEAEPVAPTWVTGNIGWASSCTGPDTEVDGAVTHEWNYDCSPQRWTASDPRLAGEVLARWNNDVYRVDDGYMGDITVNSSLDILENDGGRWVCSSAALLEGRGQSAAFMTDQFTTTCVGQEGYEGLSALLIREVVGQSEGFVGLVFSGDVPPLPGSPAAE